jgi:hypothetical protein
MKAMEWSAEIGAAICARKTDDGKKAARLHT